MATVASQEAELQHPARNNFGIDVIRQTKTERIDEEVHHRGLVLAGIDDMAQALPPGLETCTGGADEWGVSLLQRAIECLLHITFRISEADQAGNPAAGRKLGSSVLDSHAETFQAG